MFLSLPLSGLIYIVKCSCCRREALDRCFFVTCRLMGSYYLVLDPAD